jgi:hypothetical protein
MSQQGSDAATRSNGQDGVGALMWLFLVVWLVGSFGLLIWAISPSLTFFGEIARESERAEARSRWNVATWLLLGYGASVGIFAVVQRRWIWGGVFACLSGGVLLVR